MSVGLLTNSIFAVFTFVFILISWANRGSPGRFAVFTIITTLFIVLWLWAVLPKSKK